MRLFDRTEPGAWVSGAAHAALLAAVIVGFTWETFPDAQEGIAVEIVTDNQLAEMTRGERQAEVVQPELKLRAERVADTQEERPPGEASKDVPSPPTRPPEMALAEREVAPPPPPPAPPPVPPRREVAKAEPPPAPPRREAERKPEAKAETKREETAKLVEREAEEAEAKARAAAEREKAAAEARAKAEAAREKAENEAKARAEAKALAEAKARAEAEAKAVAEAKLKAEIKAKAEEEAKAKRQAEVADRFDPGDIRKLLGLREPAQSTGATGREVQRTAALGTATGNALKLNPSQRTSLVGFLQDQIQNQYYKVPGSDNETVVLPVMEIRLNADGSLAAEPRLLRVGPKPIDRAVADAALRAVRKAAPFKVPALYAPFYGDWKLLNVEFTPT